MKTSVKWLENMAFEAELDGHKFVMDANEKVGGQDKGPRPKAYLLTALCGCSGMDIVSILKKMHVTGYSFEMQADADMTEDHPKVYSKIYFNFYFEGDNLPLEKIKKAINLSQERYCGVAAMLKQVAPIEVKLFINNKREEL